MLGAGGNRGPGCSIGVKHYLNSAGESRGGKPGDCARVGTCPETPCPTTACVRKRREHAQGEGGFSSRHVLHHQLKIDCSVPFRTTPLPKILLKVDAILEDQQSKGGEDSTDKLLRNAAKDIVEYDFEEKTKELKEFKAKAKALKTILVSVRVFWRGWFLVSPTHSAY